MICKHCGAEMRDDSRFCPQCGETVSSAAPDVPAGPESTFTGTYLACAGYMLLLTVAGAVTFGIVTPWVWAAYLRWRNRHTFIQGRQLFFDGTGWELFWRSLLWIVLTCVTFGLFLLIVYVSYERWRVSHTYFASREGEKTI